MENESFEQNTTTASEETVVKMATTTFVEDGSVVSVAHNAKQLSGDMTVQNQAMKDFMMKPFLVNQSSWSTATAANADIYSFSVSSVLTANVNWMNKIQGFNNVRGKAVLRVMINANPFQAGRLLLHFLPCAGAMDASYVASMNVGLITKSQHPHVELDCRDGVAELEMPYITPYYYYDIKSGNYDWGNFYITVLSPLITGASGETTIDISSYLYFKDFEMSAPLVPQSKKWSRKGTEVESTYSADRPISSSLSIVAKAADSLASIPYITGVMEPISWMVRGASGLASFFGWSKPQSESTPAIMTAQYNRYSATCEGADCAYPTALIATNRVKPLDSITPYDGDEMSFAFLKKVVSFYDTYSWTTSQTTGTSLLSLAISPYALFKTGSKVAGAHTTSYMIPTPLKYLANGFAAWRGSIKVILKIVKTEFHTGRIQITWTPSQSTPYTVPTTSTGLLSLREIIDIRSSNEICLELPYLIPVDYLPIATAMGNLDIIVLNELRCPETASSSIQILMFVAGGDDLEFQGPVTFPPVFSPQSNTWSDTKGSNPVVCDTIGDEKSGTLDFSHSSLAYGEHFTSVKQLLNRFSNLFTSATLAGSSPAIYIYPWSIGVGTVLSTGYATNGFVGDAMSYFAPCYLFRRGSVRLGLQLVGGSGLLKPGLTTMIAGYANVVSTTTVITNTTLSPVTTAGTNYPGTYGNKPGPCGIILNDGTVNSDYYHIPYYCNTRASLNVKNSVDNYIVQGISAPTSLLGCSNIYSNVTGAIVNRSCGDDFQLSYFIGCPPITISTT